MSLTEEMFEFQKLKKDLEEKLADSEDARRTDEDIHKELEEQVWDVFLALLDHYF